MVDAVGALLSATLQVLFDRIARRELIDFFRRNNLNQALLKQLEILLLSVKAVLGDAEEDHIIDPNVEKWVDELRDAIYDAENFLDEIVTKASQCNSNSGPPTIEGKLRDYFSSVNSRLETINQKLTLVVDLKRVIGLKEGKLEESQASLPTTCFPDESEPIYGRDSDKEKMIEFLLANNVNGERLSVFAIVGMPGVGKTTLAQHLFSDSRLEGIFQLKSWVYVSERSDVFDLTKKVYDSLTKSNTEIRDLNTLQDSLRSELKDKRFLLVLDDFWSEKFYEWDLVKRPLTNGAPGSVVVVTTRNENVALTLRATGTRTLPLLEFEDCWKIFAHHAFGTKDADENETLMEIGKKIVNKCKGLPLSAKVLGSLLRSTDDALEWDDILHSKIWDLPADKSNILPALRVSYRHLPLHLKRCFAFCSIFPKGCVVSKWILIFLWMAHGLLLQSKSGKTMEKIGDEYLHGLLSRSFLQRSMYNDLDFEMHDLMNDLAQHAGGERFHKLEGGILDDSIPEKVHHLSFLQDKIDAPKRLEAFHDLSQLRTFLPFRLPSAQTSNSLTHGSFQILLQRLVSLRVLSLSNFSLSTLPNSVQYLKHLRYLNLSQTKITQLPDFVVSLYNLLTLLLSSCDCLIQLPSHFSKLTNLRHLDLSGTRLRWMPPQFSKLQSLQLLTTFFVSSNNGSKISELGALTQLCGTLSIVNLQNVYNVTEASEAKLKEMKFLKELNLSWTNAVHCPQGNEKDVLDKLQPHKYLQKLKIERFGGAEFPQWVGHASFSNMVSVHLNGCRNCLSLPPLGQLYSVKTLRIAFMTRLKKVSSEFYGVHTKPFKSLEILSFEDMLEWEEWIPIQGKNFPSLQELHLQRCPNLKGNLNHQMPLLNKLVISKCGNLQLFPVGNVTLQLQALQHFHLESSCNTLDSFPLCSFPALCDLHIEDCHSLQSLSISPQFEQDLCSLKNLVLKNCPNLVFFPIGGLRTPSLSSLCIIGLVNLKSLNHTGLRDFTTLKHLEIDGCDMIEDLPDEGFPTSLYSLCIKNCRLLVPLCQRDSHLISGIPQIIITDQMITDQIIQEHPLVVA